MRVGDVVLAELTQQNDYKLRPAVLLAVMPPFNDWLMCGISTRLDVEVEGFDEVIASADADFAGSGLRRTSSIRLGFLAVASQDQVKGILGSIAPERHERLLHRLSEFLLAS